MRSIPTKRKAGGADSLDRSRPVTFDARNLHQPGNRVAGHAQMMFKGNFGCILDLVIAPAQCCA